MAKTRRQRERKEEIKVASARGWVEKRKSEFSNPCLSLPQGYEWLEIKDSKSRSFDFMMYVVGEGNPHADPGTLFMQRTYYQHANFGPGGKSRAICPQKTFLKPCPICEYREANRDNLDKDGIKNLYPKERQLWLPREVTPDGDGQVYIWDVSYHLFGKHLMEFLDSNQDEGDFDLFAHPEEGMTIKLGFEPRTIGEKGKPFYDVSSILFKQRKHSYTIDDCREMPCLDELLVEVPYLKLKNMFFAEEDDADEDKRSSKAARKPATKKGRPVDDEDDEADDWDDEAEDDEDEEPPVKKSKSSKAKASKAKADDWDDEDEEPPVKKSKSSKAKAVDDDDWDDDEDDEEEEQDDEEECRACGGSGKNSKGRPCPVCTSGKKPAAPKAKSKPFDKDDDEDDDWGEDEDDEEEEEPPKKKAAVKKRTAASKKAAPKKKGRKPVDDDEDDDDDDWD